MAPAWSVDQTVKFFSGMAIGGVCIAMHSGYPQGTNVIGQLER